MAGGELEFHAVVGDGDVVRKRLIEIVDVEAVGEVGEECLFGANLVGGFLCFTVGHVVGMWSGTKGVDDEDVEVYHERSGLVGDGFDIGHVGDGVAAGEVEAEAVGFDVAVDDGKRGDPQVGKGEGAGDGLCFGADVVLVDFVGEGPGEHVGEGGEGVWSTVERERVLAVPAEGTEVVEAHDVVEVLVGDEDGVDMGELFAEGLLPEVGAEIDEGDVLRGVEDDGAAGTVVAGVVGGADRAVAADDGDADGGGGAEEGEGGGCGHQLSVIGDW